MKALVIVAICFAAALAAPLLTTEFIEEINSKQNLWTAGINERFAGMDLEEMVGLLGVIPQAPKLRREKPVSSTVEAIDVPDAFDIRDKWPQCKGAIRDQGQCGSCWAFGCIEAFEDRVCIVKSQPKTIFLSAQAIVDCQKDTCYGCGGGWPAKAFEYLVNNGAPLETCYPYKAYDQPCRETCSDGSAWNPVFSSAVQEYTSQDEVKNDILSNGPIETWFAVYTDFFSYTSGIYTPTTTALAGYHAIEVLGWGVQSGTKYWIAANSWGKNWGMQGYFNIQAGTCQFDDTDHFVSGVVATTSLDE